MHLKNAIVVVVDRLSASYLGPYGNTWIDTPELNRLASQLMLFEFALSNSPYIADAYRSYWLGATGFPQDRPANAGLPARLREMGVQTALVTDDPQVSRDPLAMGCEQVSLVEHGPADSSPEITQTEIARTFAGAVEMFASLKPPFVLWLHARGMGGAWDAPYEFRQQFADEDDPEPPYIVEPPELILSPDYDPDELWGYARCYAGQVLVLDACMGALLDALLSSPHADSTLLMLTSPRGFPMGEHLRVGAAPPALYGELLHIPWLVRQPDREGATLRRQSLAQSSDMFATLLAWFDQGCELPIEQSTVLLAKAGDAADVADVIRPHSVARCGEQIAIRTPHWFFRRAAADEVELFVKPDDRCEANEVAIRCSDIATELDQLATRICSPDNLSGHQKRP